MTDPFAEVNEDLAHIAPDLRTLARPLGELAEDPRNARRHPQENLDAIVASLRAHGQRKPIVVREGIVVAGNGTIQAARKLGWTHLACSEYDGPEALARAFAIADNRAGELAEWDNEALLVALVDADAAGLLEATGYAQADAEAILNEGKGKDGVDEGPTEPPAVAVSRVGEVFELGPHLLMCGDSTDDEAVRRLLDGADVALVWTDPPYGIAYVGKTKGALEIQNDALSPEATEELANNALAVAAVHAKPGCVVYVACPSGELLPRFIAAFTGSGFTFKHSLVWLKDQFVMGRCDYHYRHETVLYGWKEDGAHYFLDDRTQDSVLEFARPKRSEEHPCLRPGSEVLTETGWEPIDSLVAGDRVLVADGQFRPVREVSSHVCNGPILRVSVEDDAVEATKNHPFLVLRGHAVAWVAASQIRIGDDLMTPLLPVEKHNTMKPCEREEPAVSPRMATSESPLTGDSECSTSSYGRRLTAPCLPESKSTTRTRTSRTTSCRILNFSTPLHTSGFTPVASCETESGGSRAGRVACSSRPLPSTGTSPRAGSPDVSADHASSRRSSRSVAFELRRVESVVAVPYSGPVWNLTVEGSPTFQTRVGMSHNTMKPVELVERMIQNSSRSGDLVYDPFTGSGTTLIASAKNGRRFAGCELDPRYADVIRRRWTKFAKGAGIDPGSGALE